MESIEPAIAVKRLAQDMIITAYNDLIKPPPKRIKQSAHNREKNKTELNRHEAIKWFTEKSSETLGYGWCINNLDMPCLRIEKKINDILKHK